MKRSGLIAVAAATVLLRLFPNDTEQLNAQMTNYLSAIPAGPAKSEGVGLGQDVAAKIIADRQGDGADAPDSYRPKTKPGVYVPTPITASSMWPEVKPFAMTSPAQFRPAPPIALSSTEWAADYNEIQSLGGRASTKRTPRQRSHRARKIFSWEVVVHKLRVPPSITEATKTTKCSVSLCLLGIFWRIRECRSHAAISFLPAPQRASL